MVGFERKKDILVQSFHAVNWISGRLVRACHSSTACASRWRIIEALQQSLKGTAAEGRVSRADLIALAGAHAVAMTGGPAIDVGIDRKSVV